MALSLPITYLDSWSDTTAFTIDGTTVAIAEDNLVDGWGTLITPAGSIGALRLQNERRSYAIFGGLPGDSAGEGAFSQEEIPAHFFP